MSSDCGCVRSSASGNQGLRALCTQVLMHSIMRKWKNGATYVCMVAQWEQHVLNFNDHFKRGLTAHICMEKTHFKECYRNTIKKNLLTQHFHTKCLLKRDWRSSSLYIRWWILNCTNFRFLVAPPLLLLEHLFLKTFEYRTPQIIS